jgi:lipopolysaccharide transport system permease protein
LSLSLSESSLSPPGRFEYARDLLVALLAKELKARYKNTALGYTWSVLHPLMFTMVYLFLFKVVMKVQVENYTLFLVAGVFPWQAFQNSVCASNGSFIGNASLIKRVRFPRGYLVLTGVLNDLLHFVLSLPVILIFMLAYGVYPTFHWLWALPTLLLIQLLLTLGLSFLVATCNLFLRDLERLTSIFMMLWFYVTPVLYREDAVPPRFQWTNYFNPMAGLTISWRHVFLGTPPDVLHIAIAAAWAGTLFLVGYTVYRRLNWRFAEIV